MIALSEPQHVWKPSGYFKTSLMAQALKQTSFEHMVCTRGDPDSLFRVLRLLRNTVESDGVYDAELLSLAIESRRTDVLRFLLGECKINPNIDTVDPADSPLRMAVRSGHPASLDLLLEHGLEIHRIQFTWAISSECPEYEINSVIERLVLLPDININRPDRTGKYPLHIAIDHGKIDVVKCMLRLGADKELTCTISHEISSSQLTALGRLLYKPTLKSTLSILELLLHPEEGMGQPSSHIVSPTTCENSLHVICSAPLSLRDDAICLSCFKILWESYSDEEKMTYMNDFNEAGQTPLHCAVFSGNFPCVEELVQLGADVNLKDRHGRRQTSLDIACFLSLS
jgi:ankyrin repeat protein